ncbi:trypsin-like peptidase domain-containing protein [Streptomyces sp. NPDC050448]|uniref:nSTAND1 domain-containing NTPase n=1 Tax=Streptomyces sp. NPDC050448 TaxID=3155404 RepID=UPI003415FC6F
MSSPGSPGQLAWERGTARVLHNGRPVGVAFLIPGRLLLTCAHVISAIADLPDRRPLPAHFPVTLDFPLLPGHPTAAATVHFSVPVAADNSGDVAVLQLAGRPPADAVPMRILEADDLTGHRWRAFGFPRYPGPDGSKDAGIWTRGTIEGREGTGWWQLTCDEQAGFPLAGGFSGAPVWDEEYQGVIGVVVAVEGDQRRRTGYALTVESLAREWPQLRSLLLADSPFRELWPFTEHDGAVFHGRANETRRLLELLGEQQVPVLPVFGASGVGKSSLVGAGLLAQTGHGIHLTARLPSGLRLTAEELLAWALASAGDADTRKADWHDRWAALARQVGDENGLRAALEQTLARHEGRSRLLLVVDQFETLLADAPETARKLDAMMGALTTRRTDGSRPAQAVVVTRIDFLPQIEQLPVLRAAWEATHVVVPPMTRDQLREAITRPLEGHPGVRFADGLVEQLLHDTPRGAAALPMLEYALSKLWARQERGFLTATAYQELGGIDGALVGNAERSLWGWADASEHEALERIFIQLVRPAERLDAGERGPDTRRVADRTQFSEHDWSLIHRLASTRLVVVTRRPTGLDTAELAHQALVESWPRLQRWIEQNRDFRTWQEELRRTVRAWQEQGRPPELTLDRHRIDEARRWLGARPAEISAEEAEFVRHSHLLRARLRRRRGIRYTALCLALVVASLAAVVAVQQHQNSSARQRAGLSRRLVTEAAALEASQPDTAKQLRIVAHRLAPTRDTYNALSAALPLPGTIAAPDVTALSSGGGLLAIAAGKTTRLWSLSDHTSRAGLNTDGTGTAVALTADGALLAVGSGNGTVQLWDTAHPAQPRRLAELPGAQGPVRGLAFARDGHILASAGWDKNVRAWQLTDPGHPRPLPLLEGNTGQVAGVAVSPDGRTVASAGLDHSVRLWDVSDPEHPDVLSKTELPKAARAVAFAPAGRTLAAAGDDGAVRLWDLTDARDPHSPAVLDTPQMSPAALAFGPNGRTLAAAGMAPEFGGVALWDVSTPARPKELPPLAGGSAALAFTADGRTLATLGRANHRIVAPADEVELWDVGGGPVRSALATVTQPAWSQSGVTPNIAMTPEGRLLATGAYDGVDLWDLGDPREPRLTARLTGVGDRVALHGHVLAVGTAGRVSLWDLTDLRQPVELGSAHLGQARPADPVTLAFSADGRRLAVTLLTSELSVLDVADPAHPSLQATLPSSGRGTPMTSFDPRNTVLSLSEGAPTDNIGFGSRLWDLSDPTHPAPATALMARLGKVTATALSPRQPVLAAARSDGTLTLWDIGQLSAPKPLGTASGITGPLRALRFGPDGTALAGIDDHGGVHLWDVSTPEHATVTGDFPPLVDDLYNNVELTAPRAGGGRLVLSAGSPGTVVLRDTDPEALARRLCSTVGAPLSTSQWHQYLPEVSYTAPCGPEE